MILDFPAIAFGASAGELEPLEIIFENANSKTEFVYVIIQHLDGIPADEFENGFKIFNTINTNKQSNGIGLSACKKIVELDGGKIWIASKPVAGTSMHFTIPKK